MKHLFILTLLATLPFVQPHAQERVDTLVQGLLQRQNAFEIQEKFPPIASSLKDTVANCILKVLLHANTNRIDSAHIYIDSLLYHHQQQLGFDNVSNFILIKNTLWGQEGAYKKAVDGLESFLNQMAQYTDTASAAFDNHRLVAQHYRLLYHQPAPSLTRPDRDVELPFIREIAGKGGAMMRIPVEMNGKSYRFILDTGANATYVNERFARENGLEIIGQTALGHGMLGEVEAGFARIDSLKVGGIVFRNPVVYVGPEHQKLDSVYYVDAVLGADFLHRVAEMQIDNERQVVRFPVKASPVPATGRNMIYTDRFFRVKLHRDGKPLYFHLDTGDSHASLSSFFYDQHAPWIDSVAHSDTSRYFVQDSIGFKIVKVVPRIHLTLGNRTVALKELQVDSKPNGVGSFPSCSGSLGQQFVQSFRKLTFNFKEGVLMGEPARESKK